MRAAAADIAIERGRDLRARRRRILVEQRLGRNHDAGETIAALAGLLVDEGLLQRVRASRASQSLDGGDGLAGDAPYRLAAAFLRLAVDQHHAAAALLEPAAEARAHQAEFVAQDIEQWRFLVAE